MARPPKKIDQVIELLSQGKGTKEIKEEVGCAESTITTARQRLAKRNAPDSTETPTNEPASTEAADVEPSEEEIDGAIDAFIKSIKIEPDKQVLTNDNDEPNVVEYECGKCGCEWEADPDEFQIQCPECGCELE